MSTDPVAGTTAPAGPGLPEAAPREAVGPLMRGIAVIRALSEAGGAQPLQELSREVGLARASLDRILATLGTLGYVRFQHRQVALAPPLMELGNAYLRSVRIPALLGPLAEDLAERLDEAVTITIADDDGAHLVHKALRPRKLMISCHVGDRLPIDRCAVGALFAATWDADRWERYRRRHPCSRGPEGVRGCADELHRRAEQARTHGVALDDEWLEPGLIAVAIPVRGSGGTTACTVSVLSFTSRHASAAELARAVLPTVTESVRRMEEVLATTPVAPAAEGADGRNAGPGPGFVESLARGLRMFTAFGEARPRLSVADAARATGLPRATARRALITLAHLGYLAQQQDGRYRLKPAVLSLGFPVLARRTLAQIAMPHLEALSARVGDSASLAVLHDDTEIIYGARSATAARLTTVEIHLGTRLPAFATAMGRVLLAALSADHRAAALRAARPKRLTPCTVTDIQDLLAILDQVHDAGYALVDEELEEGLRSIGVPIRGHDGRILAALNVAMHSDRRSAAACVTDVLPPMRSAADAIERDLVAVGPFTRLALM
ncbi:MAG TPA: IclR family transcriptional regulator C-terminal domain-containing protein [Amycolatopsis sp.]|nr:IclR family transcriptional regulator C-terminal domain-containing protein [Amycolatopsis sp.]